MTAEEKLNFRNTGTVPKVEGYVKPPPPSYGSYGQGLPPQQNPFNRFNRQIQTQPVGQQVPATQEKLNQALPPEIQTIILSPWSIIEKSFNAFPVEEMIFFLDKLMVFGTDIMQRKLIIL